MFYFRIDPSKFAKSGISYKGFVCKVIFNNYFKQFWAALNLMRYYRLVMFPIGKLKRPIWYISQTFYKKRLIAQFSFFRKQNCVCQRSFILFSWYFFLSFFHYIFFIFFSLYFFLFFFHDIFFILKMNMLFLGYMK